MGRGSGGCVETALNDKLQVFTCKAQQDAGSPSQVIDEVCACLASDKAEKSRRRRGRRSQEKNEERNRRLTDCRQTKDNCATGRDE